MEKKELNVNKIKRKIDVELKEDKLIERMNNQFSNFGKGKSNCSPINDDMTLEDLGFVFPEIKTSFYEEPSEERKNEIKRIISSFGTKEGKKIYDKYVSYQSGDDSEKNEKKSCSDKKENSYEYVNHPSHYNRYSVEVIEMMIRIYGPQKTFDFCEMNAFKYRMRMGTKPGTDIKQDLEKENWYIKKAKEIKEQYKIDDHNFLD